MSDAGVTELRYRCRTCGKEFTGASFHVPYDLQQIIDPKHAKHYRMFQTHECEIDKQGKRVVVIGVGDLIGGVRDE